MHELALADSLLSIIREEMAKHGLTRLLSVRIIHGQISAVVPEALESAFDLLITNTPLAGAAIHFECAPLVMRCSQCGQDFPCAQEEDLYLPCPHCAAQSGREIISGRELLIDHIEAE